MNRNGVQFSSVYFNGCGQALTVTPNRNLNSNPISLNPKFGDGQMSAMVISGADAPPRGDVRSRWQAAVGAEIRRGVFGAIARRSDDEHADI